MLRREFLALGATAVVAHRQFGWLPRAERAALWRPPELRPDGLVLRATAHQVASGVGTRGAAWTLGDGPIGPTLRVRRGDTARITLDNQLAEETILHWHGLHVPEAADGHPRLAIGPRASYDYQFEIADRAGTYWYHAHPHHRTGVQVYRGMAGLLLVGDAEEDALELPAGDREIGLLLQDRRLGNDGDFAFDPVMHERMEGFFGNVPFGNGTPSPAVKVVSALYRLRVVNATASRITRLGLSTGAAMTLIGVDGGLLPAPVQVDHVDLGTGERVDLLIDFSGIAAGTRVMLRSLRFPSPSRGMGGMMMSGGAGQGAGMDLLECTVTREVRERPWVQRPFPVIERLDPATATRTREFRFESAMMRHTINGKSFEMDRIDERVPFGSTEIWRFVNPAPFPHPVHMHETQFQVLSRTGGRGRVQPWEGGWKDTVLLHPGETVEVISRFDHHRGRYLMHCHNLIHEDGGMMMNFVIE
jgi:FtsP/CotA-like multicopper oxidase with cupredoxin domain